VDALTSDYIRAMLIVLNKQLETLESAQQTIVIVGGSCLALMGLRDATHDVDLISPIDETLRIAIREIAIIEGLEMSWMNSSALAFMAEDFEQSRCSSIMDLSRLKVLTLNVDDLFIMKVHAARNPQDFADLVLLWPRCSFMSANDVVERYWVSYSMAYPDDFLDVYVQQVIDRARFLGRCY